MSNLLILACQLCFARLQLQILCSPQGQLDEDWGDLQVFWPDDETWWPGKVTALNLKKCEMTLFYETGLAHAVLQS